MPLIAVKPLMTLNKKVNLALTVEAATVVAIAADNSNAVVPLVKANVHVDSNLSAEAVEANKTPLAPAALVAAVAAVAAGVSSALLKTSSPLKRCFINRDDIAAEKNYGFMVSGNQAVKTTILFV